MLDLDYFNYPSDAGLVLAAAALRISDYFFVHLYHWNFACAFRVQIKNSKILMQKMMKCGIFISAVGLPITAAT